MKARPRPFLMRLLRDPRAATLPLMAAATIPLAGMVGGALDMSRLYLVKTRLQQACDAGALAARRSMLNDTLDEASRLKGENFFRANLRSNDYGATNVAIALSPVMDGTDETGRVAGTATAQLEPALMQLFGFDTFTLNATCEAELNLTNTDVMFVLDLTGSMACLPTDNAATCVNWGNANRTTDPVTGRPFTRLKPGSRLQGLREAVTAFHATLDEAVPDGIRLRFGFVPYSSSVNMWDALPTSARNTGTHSYQSRVANMTMPVWKTTLGGPTDENSSGNISWTNCQLYQQNLSYNQNGRYNPQFLTADSNGEVLSDNQPDRARYRAYSAVTTEYTGNRSCTRRSRPASTAFARTGQFGLRHFTYDTVTDYDIASPTITVATSVPLAARVNTSRSYNMQQLASLQAAGTATGLTITTQTVDGCIEERTTGMDDIDAAATSDATRWAPTWRWLTYIRNAAAPETTLTDYPRPSPGLPYNCTKSAQRLQTMSATQVTSYLNDPAFVAMGYTYHDIGMHWGARLMAASGIFAADHVQADNRRPTARHIIFMTDGDMDPDLNIYTPYGVEKLSRRRLLTGTLNDANQKAAHNAAFLAGCAAARADGITVWVVAFGQSLTPELVQCAGDETRDFESTDTATLTSQFQNIASRIAELRLSQ